MNKFQKLAYEMMTKNGTWRFEQDDYDEWDKLAENLKEKASEEAKRSGE